MSDHTVRRAALVIAPGTTRGVRDEGDVPAAFAMVSVKVEAQIEEPTLHAGFRPAG